MRNNPTSGEQKQNRDGPVVADCLNANIFPAHGRGGMEEVHILKGCALLQEGYVRDLTTSVIAHDMMDVFTYSRRRCRCSRKKKASPSRRMDTTSTGAPLET